MAVLLRKVDNGLTGVFGAGVDAGFTFKDGDTYISDEAHRALNTHLAFETISALLFMAYDTDTPQALQEIKNMREGLQKCCPFLSTNFEVDMIDLLLSQIRVWIAPNLSDNQIIQELKNCFQSLVKMSQYKLKSES